MEARKSSVRSGAARGAPRPAALDLRPCSHSGSARSAAAPPPSRLGPRGWLSWPRWPTQFFSQRPRLAATVLPQDAFQQELTKAERALSRGAHEEAEAAVRALERDGRNPRLGGARGDRDRVR